MVRRSTSCPGCSQRSRNGSTILARTCLQRSGMLLFQQLARYRGADLYTAPGLVVECCPAQTTAGIVNQKSTVTFVMEES